VLVDGKPVQSCNTPIWAVAGKTITTIEGASLHPVLQAVQEVFVDVQAAQCGYCTNGIMMTLAGLLSQSPRPDKAHLLAHLDERHLCRCGVHVRVLKAIDQLLLRLAGGAA
jgi:aerobic-type carbon monoxide dehydrogenase small subunit (CoxS/CutS family)